MLLSFIFISLRYLLRVMEITARLDRRDWNGRNLFLVLLLCREQNITEREREKVKNSQRDATWWLLPWTIIISRTQETLKEISGNKWPTGTKEEPMSFIGLQRTSFIKDDHTDTWKCDHAQLWLTLLKLASRFNIKMAVRSSSVSFQMMMVTMCTT